MVWAKDVADSGGGWDWALMWTIVAAIVGALALVGVFYAIVGYYRDHPKRRLEYTVKSRRLVQSTPQVPLEVKVGGIDVPDPYLVEFRLASNSRADIASDSFDAGRPLKVTVAPGGAYVLGEGPIRGSIGMGGGSRGDPWGLAEFEVRPQLIRKGAWVELDWISNGEPGIHVESPLIDIDVWDVTRRPKRGDLLRLLAVFLVPMFALGMIVMVLVNNIGNGPAAIVVTSVAVGLFGVIAALFAGVVWVEFRWRDRTQQGPAATNEDDAVPRA